MTFFFGNVMLLVLVRSTFGFGFVFGRKYYILFRSKVKFLLLVDLYSSYLFYTEQFLLFFSILSAILQEFSP